MKVPFTNSEALNNYNVMCKLKNAICKENAKTPNSLDDRMERCRIAYNLSITKKGKYTPAEIIEQAEELLKEFDQKKV